MSDVASPSAANPLLDPENAPLPRRGWLRRWPGVTFLLPFVIFLLVGMIEPKPPEHEGEAESAAADAADDSSADEDVLDLNKENAEPHATMPYEYYPYVYTIKIGLTTLAMLAVLPGYLAFPFRVSGLSWLIGAVGAVVWIALAKLQVQLYPHVPKLLADVLEMGGRSGFNPLVELKDNAVWAYGFLAIRFFGLVVVVAVIEEFFLRGFLMRYVMDIDWPLIPFGVVNRLGLAVVIAFPVLYHPERLAALAWFSMVTWLMLRTRSIWDCVIAHAVTNLLLGLWVVYSGDWWLM
jgi:CAAX prenyl protease-like protein